MYLSGKKCCEVSRIVVGVEQWADLPRKNELIVLTWERIASCESCISDRHSWTLFDAFPWVQLLGSSPMARLIHLSVASAQAPEILDEIGQP